MRGTWQKRRTSADVGGRRDSDVRSALTQSIAQSGSDAASRRRSCCERCVPFVFTHLCCLPGCLRHRTAPAVNCTFVSGAGRKRDEHLVFRPANSISTGGRRQLDQFHAGDVVQKRTKTKQRQETFGKFPLATPRGLVGSARGKSPRKAGLIRFASASRVNRRFRPAVACFCVRIDPHAAPGVGQAPGHRPAARSPGLSRKRWDRRHLPDRVAHYSRTFD